MAGFIVPQMWQYACVKSVSMPIFHDQEVTALKCSNSQAKAQEVNGVGGLENRLATIDCKGSEQLEGNFTRGYLGRLRRRTQARIRALGLRGSIYSFSENKMSFKERWRGIQLARVAELLGIN
jgi:hypothetical protein